MMTELRDRITVRLPNDLHEYLKLRAKERHWPVNTLIVHVLDEARRQAELPGRRQHGGMSLADAITEHMAKVEALPDAPEWDGEGHA
jgi:hypothetical protein